MRVSLCLRDEEAEIWPGLDRDQGSDLARHPFF